MSKLEKWLLLVLPAIAPLSTAYIVVKALEKNGWHILAAVILAAALEGLGYFSARLIAAIWEHNRTLSATEKNMEVSDKRAWLPAGAYVVVTLYLTVFVEILPEAFLGAYLAFPFVGLLSAWITAEFRTLDDHTERKAQARADAKEHREQAKREAARLKAEAEATARLAQVAQPESQPGKSVAQDAPLPFTDDNLLAQYIVDPCATDEQIAQIFAVSRQAVGNRRNKLLKSGAIYRNGKEIKPGIASAKLAEVTA